MSHLIAAASESLIRAGADGIKNQLNLQSFSDDELDKNLKDLAAAQRQCTALIVAHLQELDHRDIVQRRAYPSLFAYCVKELGFSEDVACRHILAVRASRRFPSILTMLARGEISLTTISVLNRHLTAENHQGLLRWSAGKSRRELERRVAELETPTASPSRDMIRHLPSPAVAEKPANVVQDSALCSLPLLVAPRAPVAPLLPASISRHDVRFAFSAPETLLLGIERLKVLLKHKFPAGRLEDIIGEITRFYLARRDPALKKRAAARKPSSVRKRRIAQWIKDLVFQRDGGRCAFIAADGRRCEENGGLEYDHVVAWAHGGESNDPSNVRLLCRPHNQLLGREVFGRYRRSRRTHFP